MNINQKLFGPQYYEGDTRVYLAETPFVTIQGEGPNIGKNTLFIRFFGCNLANSCGVDWCDTKHSFYTNEEITKDENDNIISVAPKPDRLTFENINQAYETIFENSNLSYFNNIVITGGEPLLHQIQIASLLRLLRDKFKRTVTVEIETNGTIPIETDFIDWFRMVHFNISAKIHVAKRFPLLSQLNNRIDIKEGQYSFINFDHSDWILKFVYQGKESQPLIKECLEKYDIPHEKVYLMPEGITRKQQITKMQPCAEYCINNGFNFSPRLHVLIWNESKGV